MRCFRESDFTGCSSLTIIEREAFAVCPALTNFTGCSSLTTINVHAFQNCDALTSVDFTGCSSLTAIEEYMFYFKDTKCRFHRLH